MTAQVGDRIELLAMPDDPSPIESGAVGTVRKIEHFNWPGRRWTQISVDWDNGRTLHLCVPPDTYRVITDPCEFEQRNPHEWYCTTHDVLVVSGTQEPNSCHISEI